MQTSSGSGLISFCRITRKKPQPLPVPAANPTRPSIVATSEFDPKWEVRPGRCLAHLQIFELHSMIGRAFARTKRSVSFLIETHCRMFACCDLQFLQDFPDGAGDSDMAHCRCGREDWS